MKLGDIVREFRQSHGMTMQEFADLASLSKGYISMLEKGRNPRNDLPITPSIDTYAKIARAMNMTAEELLAKAKGEDVAIPAPAAEPMGLTARAARPNERSHPLKAIDEDTDVRSVARDRLKGVSKEEIALKKQQLKAMVAAMWMKEENEK